MAICLLTSKTKEMLKQVQHDRTFQVSFILKRHSELVSESLDNINSMYS